MLEQLKQTQEMIAKLLSLIEIGETDKFAAHLLPGSRVIPAHFRATEQGQQATEREIISSYQIAQSLGSTVTFARGSTCCGFTTDVGEEGRLRRDDWVKNGWRYSASLE